MKTTIIALAIASAFTSAALAQSVGEKTGVNSALGITPKTEDCIKEAATGGYSAVSLDRLPAHVQSNAKGPGTRATTAALLQGHRQRAGAKRTVARGSGLHAASSPTEPYRRGDGHQRPHRTMLQLPREAMPRQSRKPV